MLQQGRHWVSEAHTYHLRPYPPLHPHMDSWHDHFGRLRAPGLLSVWAQQLSAHQELVCLLYLIQFVGVWCVRYIDARVGELSWVDAKFWSGEWTATHPWRAALAWARRTS